MSPHVSGVVDSVISMREAAIKCIDNVLVTGDTRMLHWLA